MKLTMSYECDSYDILLSPLFDLLRQKVRVATVNGQDYLAVDVADDDTVPYMLVPVELIRLVYCNGTVDGECPDYYMRKLGKLLMPATPTRDA